MVIFQLIKLVDALFYIYTSKLNLLGLLG